MGRARGGFAACVILTLALSACAERQLGPTSGDLGDLLAFKAPQNCEAGPTFFALLRSVLGDTTERPVKAGRPALPDRFRSFVGTPRVEEQARDEFHAVLPLRGTWLGLPVESVTVVGYSGGDSGGFRIGLHASRAKALAALNRAGFRVPDTGDRIISTDGVEMSIGLTSAGATSVLRCNTNE